MNAWWLLGTHETWSSIKCWVVSNPLLLIYLSIYLSIYLFLSVCLSISLSVCLSVCLSTCQPTYLPACLPIYIYIYIYKKQNMKSFSIEKLNFFFRKFCFSYILDLAKTVWPLRILPQIFTRNFLKRTLSAGV